MHQDNFWGHVKSKLMDQKGSSLETYMKLAVKAAREYLSMFPEEASGEWGVLLGKLAIL